MLKWNVKYVTIITAVLAVLVAVAVYFFQPKAKLPKAMVIDTTHQPTLGSTNAKIHIVVFEDLKCMNCRRFNLTLFPFIKEHYIDSGKAKYTVMNLAFVPGSIPAATAARCVYAQNHKLFFPYIETLFKHQPPEYTDWATIPTLVRFAKSIPGIDTKQLSECIFNMPYTEVFNHNLKVGMHVMPPPVSTPTLYVNGVMVKPLNKKRLTAVISALS